MPRILLLPFVLACAATAAAGCRETEQAATGAQSAVQAQGTETLSTTDATFINTVGAGGIAEVKFAQLAQTKAVREDVRTFAAQMVTDHSKANRTLESIARRKGMTPPSDMDATHQALYQRLSEMNGPAFDTAYMQAQVDDHAATVTAFQDESQNGTDIDVRGFAQQNLAVIQHHLEMAHRIAGQ